MRLVQGQERKQSAIIDAQVYGAARALRRSFERAEPFKHFVVDGFFEPAFARRLLDEFPAAGGESSANFFGAGAAGKKTWHSDLAALGGAYAVADAYFRSNEFLDWMSEATGIDGLIYDETNYGGGTHENFEGRDLVPHVDFNIHPVKKLHRRLNLIVYLNERWQAQWGGAIALYSDPRDPLGEVVEHQPLFNRAIAFETSERSWHGFERLTFPPQERGRTRKSLSIYLYTRERPSDEVYAEHTTIFVPRPLPPRYVEGLTLTQADARELGALVGQRDRLIALYQAEVGKREPDSEQAARLRIELAELQRHRTLPVMGYAVCSGPVEGLFSDGWSPEKLTFSIVPERDVTAVFARVRVPLGLARPAQLTLRAGERTVATVNAQAGGLAELGGRVAIARGEIARMCLETSVTANHKDAGISEDRRDLGFLLERLTFEHAAGPILAAQYAFAGDSHASAFDGLFFPAGSLAPADVLTRGRWEPFATAEGLFADGRCTPLMTRMLYDLRLVRPRRGEQAFDAFATLEMPVSTTERAQQQFEPRRSATPLVISCGEPELWDVASALFGRRDFSPEEPLRDRDSVRSDIERRSADLLRGLIALRDAGFTNLFLAAIPPPSPRNSAMPPESTRLRYQVASTFNSVYRAFCASSGVGFLDTWDWLTVDGLRNPDYDRDGVHLNAAGAAQVIRCLQTQLDRTAT